MSFSYFLGVLDMCGIKSSYTVYSLRILEEIEGGYVLRMRNLEEMRGGSVF